MYKLFTNRMPDATPKDAKLSLFLVPSSGSAERGLQNSLMAMGELIRRLRSQLTLLLVENFSDARPMQLPGVPKKYTRLNGSSDLNLALVNG